MPKKEMNKWSENEVETLVSLIESANFTIAEIAEKMERTKQSVQRKSERLGLHNRGHIKWSTEMKIMIGQFYVVYGPKPTMEKFQLERAQLDIIVRFCHKHEVTERPVGKVHHNDWSLNEKILLLRYSGIQTYEWIARKLNKTSREAPKGILNRMGISMANVNGLPQVYFWQTFGIKLDKCTRTRIPGIYEKIVPWVMMEDNLDILNPDLVLEKCVKGMASFQRHVHRAENNEAVLNSIWNIYTE